MQELPLKCKNCKALITLEDVTEIGIYKIPAYRGSGYIRCISIQLQRFLRKLILT